MGQPYVGEIRLFAGNFAPSGWFECDGTLLPISENETLFQLIGTTYGGDGETTFALPDLSSRIPLHQSSTHVLGETGGAEQVTLTTQQVPNHSHTLTGTSALATASSPAGGLPATLAEVTTFAYGSDQPLTTLSPQVLAAAGGSQPHENLPPFLALRFIIAAFGIFPSPT